VYLHEALATGAKVVRLKTWGPGVCLRITDGGHLQILVDKQETHLRWHLHKDEVLSDQWVVDPVEINLTESPDFVLKCTKEQINDIDVALCQYINNDVCNNRDRAGRLEQIHKKLPSHLK
jgi:hypothetical protein